MFTAVHKNRAATVCVGACCALLLFAGDIATAATAATTTTIASSPVASASVALAPTASPIAEELLLAISINGQKPTDTVLIKRDATGALLVRREDLLRWRLLVPQREAVSMEGDAFYPLTAFAGLSYRIDESQQALLLDVPVDLFSQTTLAGSRGVLNVPTSSPLGGFLNYDVFVDHDPKRTATNALAELGAFNAWGVGLSSFLRQDLPEGARVVRLASTWTHDRPTQMTSVRFGDLINANGSWGRSVRFGGVQWATNFATQPGLITFPRPAMAGEAILPSTLDLYVNDALRMRRQVPAGPFAIEDMPVLTGQGEARLVVTDLLGREQVIVAPYYASPQLLQADLNAYSFELGAIREDFGIASNHYGRALAVGTFRHGLTDRFTAEAHTELLEQHQAAGVGGVFLLPAGVFSASLAASHSQPTTGTDIASVLRTTPGGSGGLLGLAFQGQSNWLGYGANLQLTSARFSQVGLEPGQPSPRQTRQVYVNVATHRAGSFGLSYAYQDRRIDESAELLNASYSVTLGGIGFLGLSVLRVLRPEATSVLGLNFTRLFGTRDTGSINASSDADSTQAYLRLQRSLPPGDGMGYRVLTGLADSDRREAAVSMQNRVGTYSAEIGQAQGATSYRGSASGGVALLGTDAFLSRRVDNSFAVVHVPGYANVDVYHDNQPIARTNEHGTALIARLRPYQVNSIRIEAADLPMDAQIGTLQLDAIPYLRSGLSLSFPIKRSRGALFTIVLDSGEPLPAGAVAKLVGHAEEFPVGLNGQVYMTDLDATNRIALTWREQSCEFALAFPESTDPLPDLGTHRCSGVKR
jgi:outer membrane usher protein